MLQPVTRVQTLLQVNLTASARMDNISEENVWLETQTVHLIVLKQVQHSF